MLESAEITDTLREGPWHQGHLYEAWHEYQRHLAADIHFEHPGWLTRPTTRPNEQRANNVEQRAGDVEMNDADAGDFEAELSEDHESGRAERTRLLSLDGVTDPRNDRTIHDDDFAALHDLSGIAPTFLPTGDVSRSQHVIEEELTVQQTILRELEGNQPFPPGLPSLF
jgi:hypothetical protein